MLIKFAEYCGFEISATFRSTAHGFMPIVFVGKHGENGLDEEQLLSPLVKHFPPAMWSPGVGSSPKRRRPRADPVYAHPQL